MNGPDGDARLPTTARPQAYRITLTVDPARDRFRGEAEIDVELDAPTSTLTLHGGGLNLDQAQVWRGGEQSSLTLRSGRAGGLALDAAEPLAPGRITLALSWQAPLDEVPEGAYRTRYDGRWYAFTQFEPLAARRVFPCFDEPAFKAPVRLTLRVPRGLVALSNTPEVERQADGPFDRVVFAEGPPIASYLVAFAVGPFDVVAAPADAAPIPLRVVTTHGRGHLAAFALRVTPPLLQALADWCGTPYPYAKLDLVGVPDFAAGAMENVALVTFRERLLLLDDDNAPAHDRLWAQLVIAHELAHMWFGNLVTMPWWDDLWLNEAFATWLETMAVDAVSPELHAGLEAVHETGNVMDHDALDEARAIRQPIVDGGDVLNAFDGITYGKGAAVVQMASSWLGADTFREGVRAYLRDHAHGNGSTDDLLETLARTSGQPVPETLAAFLDRPGTPFVDLRFDAEAPARLRLTQRRYRPDGDAEPGRWRVPMTLRYGRGDEVRTASYLLTEPEGALDLELEPEWLHPNHEEHGYYRWRMPPSLLDATLARAGTHLSLAERVALPAHLWALLESGDLPADVYCRAIERLAGDAAYLVVSGVVSGLQRLDRLGVDAAHQPAFAAFVRALLQPQLDRLGFEARPDEPPGDRLLRPIVLAALADPGEHEGVREALRERADAALADITRADPETIQVAFPVSARDADTAWLERLADAIPDAPSPAHRAAIVRALGASARPDGAEWGFSMFLDDRLRAQDLFGVLRPATRQPDTLDRLWSWLDDHFDAVAGKAGDEMVAHLPALGTTFCAPDAKARLERFFSSPGRRKPGVERPLRQALEEIDRNLRLRGLIFGPLSRLLEARGENP